MTNYMDAHFLTLLIIASALLLTPFYVLATYVFSGAPAGRGAAIAVGFALFGALAIWNCTTDLVARFGPLGMLIIPVSWLTPSLILLAGRGWLLPAALSQRWLISLQLFRAIGGTFLIETARGKIAGSFAYPAGIGDLVVALFALGVLVRYRGGGAIPARAVYGVVVIGTLDFASAFFFELTSSAGPAQLFARGFEDQLLRFPTGMIPLFLVPYAIFFHTLSVASFRRFGDARG